jgi:hypothetical protein
VPTGRLLGIHQRPVDGDLERATARLFQVNLGLGKGPLELGDQTGRPGLVVSDDAVFDGDKHGILECRGWDGRLRIPQT